MKKIFIIICLILSSCNQEEMNKIDSTEIQKQSDISIVKRSISENKENNKVIPTSQISPYSKYIHKGKKIMTTGTIEQFEEMKTEVITLENQLLQDLSTERKEKNTLKVKDINDDLRSIRRLKTELGF